MRRRRTAPRPDWRKRVQDQGLLFHSACPLPGAPPTRYWSEGVYYALQGDEVDAIEAATAELHARCLDAAAHVIEEHRYAELGIPDLAIPAIERSFRQEPPSLYGRLDLAFGPDGVPKLLEYNADTPTSLLEAAVIQWTWLSDCFPALDQFNAVHERLIERWAEVAPYLDGDVVHFGFVDGVEDEMTIAYLRDTSSQVGLRSVGIAMGDIGWDERRRAFVDLEDRSIRNLFKLYPWEGLIEDPFGPLLLGVPDLPTIEPAWKMILSTKAILPILWELFPEHPNLLPASRVPLRSAWVKKPLHGREGSNVTISAPGVSAETPGPYGHEGFVFQAYTDLGEHDGMRPVVGSWLIGEHPAGIGIRETPGYVTDDLSCFVPHAVE